MTNELLNLYLSDMLGLGEATVKRKISAFMEFAFFLTSLKTVVILGLSLERDAFAAQGMSISEKIRLKI